MRMAWSLLCALALLGVPGAAEARRPPTRAQLERIVDAFYACRVECGGLPRFHRRLTSARCDPVDGQGGRIMCVFSGYDSGGDLRRPRRFRRDCAYLDPTPRGWVMYGTPDAEFCE